MKKIALIVFTLLSTFIVFLFILFSSKNYTLSYSVNDFNITETYVKALELYKVFVNHNDEVYPYIVDMTYTKNRRIVDEVRSLDTDDLHCMTIVVKNNDQVVCMLDSELVLPSYDSDDSDVKDKYKLINIYNYIEGNIYIWNYKGYDLISENNNQEIEMLKKDDYESKLSYQHGDYIIIPEYDSQYYFYKFITLDNNSQKIDTIESIDELSYNSRFTGSYKKHAYFLDEKSYMQYRIDPKKKTIKEVKVGKEKGVIYYDDVPSQIQLRTIINDNLKNSVQLRYEYTLIDDHLYLLIDSYKIKLSEKKIKELVKVSNNKVYYISQDKLYSFTLDSGEILLVQNKEWNFNYKNKVFIFD